MPRAWLASGLAASAPRTWALASATSRARPSAPPICWVIEAIPGRRPVRRDRRWRR
ncbi:hypothetical protein P4131_30210 [Pseudomonas aeruginosa]|nr:hypothetical protein [Pseudomonas aeruginosa]